MANSKLKAVLQELELERNTLLDEITNSQHELDIIEEAMKGIRKIVNGQPAPKETGRKTNIQIIENILRVSPNPMHIMGIAEIMKGVRDKKVSRATIDTAISRHLKNHGKDSKIERLGDGMYQYRRMQETNRGTILTIQ